MENVKIKKVELTNLKAVSSFTAFFDGKCAHVTGENGIGKSTVIRTFTDRLRGLKPSIITKIGEKEGKTVLELTDGCRFEWLYNEGGRDELSYFTKDSFKPVRRDVFKHICGQYFPNQFDINKFLTTTEPRKRLDMISELLQVDLSEVQSRYKDAFDFRRDAKKELQILEAQIKPKPEGNFESFEGFCDVEQKEVDQINESIKVKKSDIETERDSLNEKYLENKKFNDKAQAEHEKAYKIKIDNWIKLEDEVEDSINLFNKLQHERSLNIKNLKESLIEVDSVLVAPFKKMFDFVSANNYINGLPKPEELKIYTCAPKPELEQLNLTEPMPPSENLDKLKSELVVLENSLEVAEGFLQSKKDELNDLSASKQVYDVQLKQYNDFQADIKKQSEYVRECQMKVETILSEIKTIISSTKLPDDFSIDLENKNDILFRTDKDAEYLPITNETLASSAIFIAAFKLQANYLEAFRVAHFDVSYLDYKNREKVLKEAIAMDIQLITESPAYNQEDEMLQYKITED